MKTQSTLAALMIAATAVLTGCASTAPTQSPAYSSSSAQPDSSTYGTIDSIQATRTNAQPSGAGAVAGGLVGALLGNQVGSGNGRTAATVAGAVGGAVVGNEVERNRAQGQDAYQVSVRLDNGDYRTVVQDNVNELRVGNRVRVVDGRVYRY
ncbi:MAG: glycine zipper 2TM domain-containing protein [Pseudomonadota bacterium]